MPKAAEAGDSNMVAQVCEKLDLVLVQPETGSTSCSQRASVVRGRGGRQQTAEAERKQSGRQRWLTCMPRSGTRGTEGTCAVCQRHGCT